MVKTKKIRLKDIAYSLGVSVTCVSRSLRDCSDISEDTKKLIRAKAIELGYQSKYNEIKTKEKYVVALIFDSIKNPYFIKLGDYLISRLNKEDYDFLIMITDPFVKVDDLIIKKCIFRNADIILSFNEFSEKAVEISKINNIPLVLLGRISAFDYVDSIFTDDKKGGHLAFNYLVNENKRKLLYIEESRSEASLRRLAGFQKDKEKHPGLDIKVVEANNLNNALDYIKKGYDGIFTYNDYISLDLIKLLESNNLLNENLKIVGYDDDVDYLNKYFKNYRSVSFDYEKVSDLVISIIKNKLEKKIKRKTYLFKIDVKL